MSESHWRSRWHTGGTRSRTYTQCVARKSVTIPEQCAKDRIGPKVSLVFPAVESRSPVELPPSARCASPQLEDRWRVIKVFSSVCLFSWGIIALDAQAFGSWPLARLLRRFAVDQGVLANQRSENEPIRNSAGASSKARSGNGELRPRLSWPDGL